VIQGQRPASSLAMGRGRLKIKISKNQSDRLEDRKNPLILGVETPAASFFNRIIPIAAENGKPYRS